MDIYIYVPFLKEENKSLEKPLKRKIPRRDSFCEKNEISQPKILSECGSVPTGVSSYAAVPPTLISVVTSSATLCMEGNSIEFYRN